MPLPTEEPAPLPPLGPLVVAQAVRWLVFALFSGLGFVPAGWLLGGEAVAGWAVGAWAGANAFLAGAHVLLVLMVARDAPPGHLLLAQRRVPAESARLQRVVGQVEGGLLVVLTVWWFTLAFAHADATVDRRGALAFVLATGPLAVAWAVWGRDRDVHRFNRAILRHVAGDDEGALQLLPQRLPGARQVLVVRARAAVLMRLGRAAEAVELLERRASPPGPDGQGYRLAAARLACGDDRLARELMAGAPSYPLRGGDRTERHHAVVLRAVLALVDDQPTEALNALDGVGERLPADLEQALVVLRSAAWQAHGDRGRAEAALAAGPPVRGAMWFTAVPAVRRLVAGLGVPLVEPRAERGGAVEASADEPLPPVRALRRGGSAHLLPVENVSLGPRVVEVPPVLMWLLGALSLVYAALLVGLAVTLDDSAGLVVLLFPGMVVVATVALMQRQPRGPGTHSLGDGTYVSAETLGVVRARRFIVVDPWMVSSWSLMMILLAFAPGLWWLGVAVVVVITWLRVTPGRRLDAAWVVRTAPLADLPAAMAPHRGADTEAWWVLAHLVAGRTDEAEALDAQRPARWRLPVPLATWFGAARGELQRDDLALAARGRQHGPRLRRAVAVVLQALATGEVLDAAEVAEARLVAEASPGRFGAGLHRLLWHHLRFHDPAAAEELAAAHRDALEDGVWVDGAWPNLTHPAEQSGGAGLEP